MARASKKPSLLKKRQGVRSTSGNDLVIGGRLRAMRIDRGMSQSELGKLLGVSFQQIQKYEKGTNRLSIGRAMQIAAIFHTTVEQLTGGNGPQVDGFLFDTESYKLAKSFSQLPDHLKSKLRSLINTIIAGADAE